MTLTHQARRRASRSTLAITRDVVQEREVASKVLAGGTVGYVRLAGFSDAGAIELHDALAAHVEAGRTKLILDLRGNPGGYVTAARNDRQPVHRVGRHLLGAGRAGQPGRDRGAPRRRRDRTRTCASSCLIDGGSASASEIVAGALQDTKRATLVGQQSFGKGTVQQWQELTGEGGAFKLTIARWLTPDKRWIHEVGLTPDVVVDAPGRPARRGRIRRSTRRSRCSAPRPTRAPARRRLTRPVRSCATPDASGTVLGNERR